MDQESARNENLPVGTKKWAWPTTILMDVPTTYLDHLWRPSERPTPPTAAGGLCSRLMSARDANQHEGTEAKDRKMPPELHRPISVAEGEAVPRSGPELDEPGLVEAVQAGDRAAVSRVLELCLPSLRTLVTGRFRLSREEGEDILQEVQVAFLQSANRFQGGCSLHTYLVRIACHKCIDYLRAQRRSDPGSSSGEHGTTGTGQSRMLDTMIDRLAMGQALARLSPRERELIELFYGQGRSYREIATQLGIAVGTVGGMKAEALAKLREALQTTRATGSENQQ